MPFCYGLLVWPSGLVAFCLKAAFWYGLLVESGLLLWPSGKAFWCGGLLVERGSLLGETPQYNGQVGSMYPPTPSRWLLLWTVRILLECILVVE